MYKIFADDTLIFDSTLEDYSITKGEITLEVNKSGSFVFTIQQDHPYYDRIQKMKTIVTVYKNNQIVFRGRVLTDGIGFFKDKTFTCEGELSFLLDSIQRPYTFTASPEDLFTEYITAHNVQVDDVKQFNIGTVTVTDPNDYINRSNSAYEDTLTNINEHLIDTHGGYIHITRNEDGKPVINWFSDFPYQSEQNIEFGENLLDFTKTNSAEEIASAIIPLGAKIGEGDDETRLTIVDVNDGLDYVYNDLAVQKYGWIFKVVTWDDVTDATNLKRKAEEELAAAINQNITIEVKAIDLSLMDRSIDSFRLGDYIPIVSKPHNLDEKMLLKKQTINLLNPGNDKITLGYTYSSFTEKTMVKNKQNSTLVNRVETIESNYAIGTVVASEIESLQSLINQTSSSITSEVAGSYVTNDKLLTELSTVLTQLNNSFEFMFLELEQTMRGNDTEYRDQFIEIQKYIRFESGNIVLGEVGNEIVMKVEIDTIAFYENGNQVAYFKNRKLYVLDGEFINSLKIGKFAFVPRENGNLSFKRVVN